MEIQEKGRGYLLYQRSRIYHHPSPLPPVQTPMLSGGRGRVLFVVTLRGLRKFVEFEFPKVSRGPKSTPLRSALIVHRAIECSTRNSLFRGVLGKSLTMLALL